MGSTPKALQNMTVVLAGVPSPPPPDDVERTATGIPIRLIWLPYVGFTLVMLGLMCLSFFHYHRKNGHKYRRRAELMRGQLNTQDIITQFQGSTPTNGGFSITPEQAPLTPVPPVNPYHHRPPKHNPHFQPNTATTSNAVEQEVYHVRKKTPIEEPLHRQNSLFRQISSPHGKSSQQQPAYSPRGVPLVTPKPIHPPPPHPPPQYPPQPSTSTNNRHGRASEYGSGVTSGSGSSNTRRHKRPLVFTSNLNGSMVDIRCGVNESHKTFRSKSNRSTSLPTTSIWTLPHLSSRSEQHHHHQQMPSHGHPKQQNRQQYQHSMSAEAAYAQGGGGGGGGGYHATDYGCHQQAVSFSPTGGALTSVMSDCEDDEVFLLHQTKL